MNNSITLPAYFLILVAALAALGPFSIDTYLPALPSMASALQTDIVQVNNTLSIYLFGFAFGQLLGGPLSDQVGRKTIGLIGLTTFCVVSIAIGYATTITEVLALRAVQAIGGGFATVISMAMVRDSYPPLEAAKQFPKVMLVMLTAPLIAPAIGAALMAFGWPSIFFFLALYAALVLVLLSRMPETALQRTGQLALNRILPQYLEVLTFRVHNKLLPLRYILAQGFMASILLIFITNSPFIYLEYYQVGEQKFVFYFAANVLGMMIGNLVTTRLIQKHPPFRLYVAGRSIQFLALISLTIVVTFTDAPVLLFTPLLAVAIGSAGIVGPSAVGLFLAPFGKLSGSASSLMNTAVFMFGSVLGVVSGLLFDGTLAPIIYIMLASSIVGNLIALTIPARSAVIDSADVDNVVAENAVIDKNT